MLHGMTDKWEDWWQSMRDKLVYINHLNQRVDFGTNTVLLNENKVRDYKWSYNNLYDKIVNFKKGITTYQIPITIYSSTKQDIANLMYETFEKDVLSQKPGKLWCGDYYMTGYIIGEASGDFVYNKVIKLTLTFITDEPYWIKENPFLFRLNNSAISEDGLGYPYDYPYDFLSPISVQNFDNQSFTDANFVMTIYGYVENPAVTVGGHTYKVNTVVNANEFLTIDSRNKTVIRTTNRGVQVNEFANRDVDAGYIFERIPAGQNSVTMSSEFNLDITIYEERSEPLWI